MAKSFQEIMAEARKEIPEVSAQQVNELLKNNGKSPVVLDVRESDEWRQGHLGRRDSLPRGFLEIKVEGAVPDKNTPIIAYCAGGVRSLLAARAMKEMGYQNVSSMAGGYAAWKNGGFKWVEDFHYTPDQLIRYSRHFLLPEVGEEGQAKLLQAKVLMVGAGGLPRRNRAASTRRTAIRSAGANTCACTTATSATFASCAASCSLPFATKRSAMFTAAPTRSTSSRCSSTRCSGSMSAIRRCAWHKRSRARSAARSRSCSSAGEGGDSYLNIAISDGEHAVVSRFTDAADGVPESLYYFTGQLYPDVGPNAKRKAHASRDRELRAPDEPTPAGPKCRRARSSSCGAIARRSSSTPARRSRSHRRASRAAHGRLAPA